MSCLKKINRAVTLNSLAKRMLNYLINTMIMKKLILHLCLFFATLLCNGQVTIYSEDFSGQQGKGAIGPGGNSPTIDLAGISWTIDVSNANLSNGSDYFSVQSVGGNELLEGRDLDTNATWFSPVIDISSYTNIGFTINVTESNGAGGNNLEDSDTVLIEYSINGSVTWITAPVNGNISNDYDLTIASASSLTGSTIQIRVTMTNNGGGERQRIDDIAVTGDINCSTPENPTTFGTINGTTNSVDLNWNLNDCNTDYLIIAKENSSIISIPSGDGSAYTANASFGNGTEIDTNEFVVYKGPLASETITDLIFGNNYFFKIFARNNTSWSSGVEITYSPDYCTSVGTRDTYDTNTTLVSFGEINNNTVVDDGAPYHDYTALSNSIALGATEDLTVNIDTDDFGGNSFNVYCYVWIDWNRDGDFDDSGETYDLGFAFGTDNGPTSNSALSITAPTNAVLGDTRMRVVSQYYFNTIPTNGPCDGSTDGEVEDYTVTIVPANDYVYNNGWTPSDPNGVASTLSNILVEVGTANFNTDTNCNNLTVNPQGSVTINNSVTLTIGNEMLLESSSTQYSSLISDGSIIGSVRYERHVNIAAGSGATTTANDLVSAPLSGQSFGDFRTANPNILSGTIAGNPAFLFGPFNPTNETYVNYSPSDDFNNLSAGNGYRTGSTDNGTYSFTGNVENGNVDVPVVSGGDSNWNLIGNPYPSYLRVDDFLGNVNNRSLMDINAVGVYGYDGAAQDGWTIYNLATSNSSTVITPGQGFFINANASGDIQFTPSMRTIGASDDFIAGRNTDLPLVYLKLKLSSDDNNYRTDFYFNENSSLSLDPGYDAKVWGNTPPNFSIYSHLVQNNSGEPLAIQSLHSNDLFNVTIPLGIKTLNTDEIEFSITESTIPSSIDIYLEDTEENTLTLLTDTNYTLIPNAIINGTGRFYLRLVDNQLNLNQVELESLNIYADYNNKTIVIDGLINQATEFLLYDIQGRKVKRQDLQLNINRQVINTSHLTEGVYIVKLSNPVGIKTKKTIIK